MTAQDILTRLVNSSPIDSDQLRMLRYDAAEEISRLRDAIRRTLDENRHLADGNNCTLMLLKTVIDYD